MLDASKWMFSVAAHVEHVLFSRRHESNNCLHVYAMLRAAARRYRWAKGCCKMQPAAAGSSSSEGQQQQYTCSRWVAPDLGWPTDLPVGDPVAIMSWEHNGVDSGSYNLTAEIGQDDGEPPF